MASYASAGPAGRSAVIDYRAKTRSGSGREFVDGAYYREIILSELTHAETIYAVRPVPHKWIADDLPRNWPEFRNLETEVGFNGAYIGECDKILLVNKLIKKQRTAPGPAFRLISSGWITGPRPE